MGGEFWLGFVMGIAAIFFIALMAPIDTIGTATERGFYTWNDTLYIVRPARPHEADQTS